MKVQTTVLLLCFLSGVLLSYVVHAKPSPALMKELITLEKYLEKKQGSDSADGQNKNQNENVFDSLLKNLDQNKRNQNVRPIEENQPMENKPNKPTNEENNNADGAEGPQENEKLDAVVLTAKPDKGDLQEEDVIPANPEVGVTPANPEEGVTPKNAEEGEKPQVGNTLRPSEGQVETGRESIFLRLNEAGKKIKDAINILDKLGKDIQNQFDNDDDKLAELEDKDGQRKQKSKQILDELKTAFENLKSVFDPNEPSSEKKSIQENAAARRSHLSDTEFLNIVHSLLNNN